MEVSVDIDKFNNDILAIQRGFAEELPKILQRAALSTFAKIRNRIQETGTNSKGEKYPGYSDNELPTFFYEGKATNSGGRGAIAKAKKEHRGLGYEEFKSANNGPGSVAFRNLTFTGDMWRNIGITGTEQQKIGLTVTVDAETQFAKNKTSWNADRIGDFMSVSEKEETQSAEDFQNEVDQYFKKIQ